jgi:hypothetical protein
VVGKNSAVNFARILLWKISIVGSFCGGLFTSAVRWIRPSPDTTPAGILLSLALRASLVLIKLQGCPFRSNYLQVYSKDSFY